jgi:hypothetical protein
MASRSNAPEDEQARLEGSSMRSSKAVWMQVRVDMLAWIALIVVSVISVSVQPSLATFPNQPPDCSAASADPDEIWPPSHKFVPIAITGVTDADGDPVTISVDGVFQNEPVEGNGSGHTSPDAILDPLEVRAEREGGGSGRVYQIDFTAADGHGGSCQGTVIVCVPHDQSGAGCEADSTEI